MGKCLAHNRQLLITCEHGGNEIPAPFARLFENAREIVASHRGWDHGALELAKTLSDDLQVPLFFNTTTRLLVELNRSVGHRQLFSEFTKHLPKGYKRDLLEHYYFPYRLNVEQAIKTYLEEGRGVLHVSVHTFSPLFEGEERHCDIGLLYDPARKLEQSFCSEWAKQLERANSALIIRKNYPYVGKSDGFATYLRKMYPEEKYAGIELEVNQKHAVSRDWPSIQQLISQSLNQTLQALCE